MNPDERFASVEYESLFARIGDVRAARQEFLAEVEAGSVNLDGVFESAANRPVIAGMKVLPAIESLPDIGKVQTRRGFAEVGIGEGDHISDVGPDARTGLPAALERHAR